MDGHSDFDHPDVEELARQVRELQDRVRLLEQEFGIVRAESPSGSRAVTSSTTPSLGDTAQIIPIVGKALLGIAGAYLLRALTEFGVVPLTAGVACGILYALFWLVSAARTMKGQRFVAAIYAGTSVLIAAPLVWEATVRFHAISSSIAASVLTFFSVFGLAISWRKNLINVAWITTLASLVTVVALIPATYDVAPFALAVLAMAAAVELSACLGHWLSLRWIVAVIADLVILLVTYLVTREGGLPEVYAPLSRTVVLEAQAALLVIYLSSTMVRTLLERSAFTGFEITQWVVALLISIGGALRVVHGDPGAMNAVALASLVLGAIFYVVSFAFLERTRSRDRNFYTYSTFGLLLAFTGSRILFSGPALALTLSVLALICLQAGKRAGRTTLEWHGALYLLSAAALSRLIPWSAVRLLGTGGGWVAPQPAAWISAGAALFGYLFVYQSVQSESLRWTDRVLVLAVAGNCAWTVAGIAAAVLTALCGKPAGSAQNAAFCPTLRTGVLTALSVAIAWGGRRWQRFELVWLVYPFMLLAAYRLIVRDLRQSETIALFASLLLYGGALVLLPRILQKREGAN